MAPELTLGVGLDLKYFRQQMRKAVNIAQSEFTARLNLKANRQTLQRETEYLTRYFRRKNYRISLETNLSAEIAKADSLIKKLNQLKTGSAVPSVSTSARTSTTSQTQTQAQRTFAQELRTLDKTALQKIYKAAAEDALLSFEEGIANNKGKIVTALNQAAQEASAGFIAALQNEKSELFKAAGEYGNSLLNGLKKTLKIASPSKEMFDIGDDAGKGFELGLIQSMEAAERTATRRMRRMLDRLARMVLMMGGMSGAEISSQIAQARALPSVDFPSTVPPARGVPIGPSATGRALTGVTQNALPGGSRFAAKYLPTDLGDELKRILRGAAYAFVDSLSQRVRQVSVREIGQAQLAPSRIAGLLPSAVGRPSAIYGGAGDAVSRRIAQAQARSAERAARIMAEGPQGFALGAGGSGAAGPFRPFAQPPRGGAIVPYDAAMAGGPSTQLPPGYFAGGKLQQALKGADQYLKQARVPLTGAIQELGGEFGNAVKQVLLFGTAYKALAFIINLPGQALEAATSLQTFNNQLLAVTGSADAANQAFGFIDGLAERFNVPLESARQGFVRLYASMEPAGFAPEQIEGLFTGISKAAATFGLSADQVDRVTYAFSQMASKGQAMSEELKGQLGDVLPGSLALFARAAQMSIPEFTKALEDGAFKGEAFQALLRNVAKVMNTEFAGGAAGAADTLQGRMNDLSNSVTKMYESFEPLVGLISAQVFPQLSGIIGDATEAIQAFVSSIEGSDGPASKLNNRSRQIYEALTQVQEVIGAVVNIFKALTPTLLSAAKGLLTVVTNISKMLDTEVGKWLANFALQAGLVNTALLLMAKTGILRAAAAMIGLITNIKRTIVQLRTLKITSVAARFALVSLGSAVVLSALGALMAKIEQVNNKMLQLASSARSAEGAIRSMSATEAIAAGKKYQYNLSLLKRLEARGGPGGAGMAQASAEEINALAQAGLTPGVSFTAPFDEKTGKYGGGFYDPAMVQSAIQRTQQLRGEARSRVESINRPSPSVQLEAIDLSAGEGTGAGKAKKTAKEIRDISADRYILEQNLRKAQEEENAVKILNLETALKILDAEENTEGILDRKNKIEQAIFDRRKELKKINEDERKEEERRAEDQLRQANEIAQAQQEYNSLLLDAQEAAGAITPEAAEQRRREIQQQQAISRLGPLLTPDQLSTLRNAFDAVPVVGSLDEAIQSLKRSFEEMASPVNQLITGAQGIGDAFANSFSAVITGSMTAKEALADFFGNVARNFANMAAQLLSQWLVMKAVGLVGSLFGGGSPAPTGGGGSGTGAVPFSTTLGNPNVFAGMYQLAGVPLTPYANGGIVKGPTMGLVGEGRYNEAIVPLPDGKSIPVELGGDGKNIVSNITVNVSNGQARTEGNSSGNDLGRKLEGAVKQVIIEELRPGGVLANRR